MGESTSGEGAALPLLLDEAMANAWPAPLVEVVDRWQLRLGGGGDRRTNSAWAIGVPDCGAARALALVEAFYHRRGLAAEVRVGGSSAPELPEELLARGYRELESRPLVLAADTTTLETGGAGRFALSETSALEGEWLTIYAEAEERHRDWGLDSPWVRPMLTPGPEAHYLAARAGEETVSVGQLVLTRHFGVIQCIATRPARRRQGGAAAVMGGLIELAAALRVPALSLAVQESNVVARRLYESLGFRFDHACRYFSLAPPA